MKIPNDELTKWRNNSTMRSIRDKLAEAYQTTICCNGPYPDPDDRNKVYKEFNRLAWKLFNHRL